MTNERRAQELIFHEVQKAVNLLQDHCKKFCDDNQAKSVPMVYLEQAVKIFLENYKKGIDGSQDNKTTEA